MQLEDFTDFDTAGPFIRAGIYRVADLTNNIMTFGLIRSKNGGWQFGEGGVGLTHCGKTRWGRMLARLKQAGFDWERYVKNLAPIIAAAPEPATEVSMIIPADGWKAVFSSEDYTTLYTAVLAAWAKVNGEMVGMAPDRSGQLAAVNVHPLFLGYMHISEEASITPDFLTRMEALKELLYD